MVALARELLTRGHRVTFVGFPDMRGKLPDDLAFAAIAERDIPPGSLQPFIDRLALLGGPLSIRRLMLDLARFAELLCRELPAAIERLRPDAMVIDQIDAASSLVATALQVPFVNVANALPLNLEPGVPPPVLPWRYDPSARGIRRNLGGYRVARLVEWPITKVIRRHAGRLGRPDIRFADQAWSDLCQITQCVRGLDFPRSELPANFHYVGPIRGPETALDVDLPDDGRPLVFCSLGTLQGSRAGIFRAVARAAAQLDVTLLIAHGGMLGERDIARLPGRPLVHGFVAQQAVLGRCDLAVTHCGFNTVLDSLAKAVPMVALPITFEQPATGARLERAGAAVVLQRWRSPRRIRKAMEAVLADSSYRANAGKLAEEIAASGGRVRAADLIEQALAIGARPAGATTARAERRDAHDDSRSGNS